LGPLGYGEGLTPRNSVGLLCYCARFGHSIAVSPWVVWSNENFARLPCGTIPGDLGLQSLIILF